MARGGMFLAIERRGFDEFAASFRSIGEAASNGDMDDLGLDVISGDLCFEGMALTHLVTHRECTRVVVTVKPKAALILYVGWLLTQLPRRATVTWRGGWPHVHCPPSDARDPVDDPTPLRPEALQPA